MKQGDVELTTAFGKQTSVLELLGEMRQRWNAGDDARRRGRLFELFTYNRMLGERVVLESQITTPLNAPLVTKNKTRRAVLSWSSRLVKGRTSSLVWPSDTGPGDQAKADAANAVLENLRQEQNQDAQLARAMVYAAMHGLIGFYTTYDPDFGTMIERLPRVDARGMMLRGPDGQPVYEKRPTQGMPYTEVLTIFDFVTSGEKDAHLGKWLLVRRWLDPDEAHSLLIDAARADAQGAAEGEGATPEEAQAEALRAGERVTAPQTTPVQSHMQSGAVRQAVEGWEMWWRPGKRARFVEGLFAAVIADKVTNATTFPYRHGQLPLVVSRVMDVDKDFYGSTWMEDAIPQQVGLNHSLRVTAHRAEVAGQVRILAVKGLARKYGDSPDGMIEVDTPEELEHIQEFKASDIPRDMFELCDRYEDGIDDTAGVSGVASSGDTAAETKNARLVAYATQIDDEQNEHARRNLEEAEAIMDQQKLELARQFWPMQRLIKTVGEDNALDAAFFSGEDFRGDVKILPAPGSETTPAGRARAGEERAQAGLVDPATGAEIGRTGLPSTQDEGAARSKVQALISAALEGQPVAADLTIPPRVAVDELRKALAALAPYGPRATMPVRALLQEYQESGMQAQQDAQKIQPAKRAPERGAGANVLPSAQPGGQPPS